jgi:putative tricarboxylic transport membrane protein
VPVARWRLQQLKNASGNAHWLGTFHTGAIAGAVTGLIKADLREYTPVAMMVEETSLVAVRADSPLRNATDLVNRLKADPGSLRIAVAPALGQNTHMAIAKPLKQAGVAVNQLTIAPFRSSGESVTALLGGHVDLVSATAPVILPHVASGRLRVLASAAAEPGSGALKGIRTWREQGVPADYVSYSGVLLPPGVNADQIRYWEDTLRQVARDPNWIALVEKSGNKPIFRGFLESTATCSTNGRAAAPWPSNFRWKAPRNEHRLERQPRSRGRMGGRAGRIAAAPCRCARHGRPRGPGALSGQRPLNARASPR